MRNAKREALQLRTISSTAPVCYPLLVRPSRFGKGWRIVAVWGEAVGGGTVIIVDIS